MGAVRKKAPEDRRYTIEEMRDLIPEEDLLIAVQKISKELEISGTTNREENLKNP